MSEFTLARKHKIGDTMSKMEKAICCVLFVVMFIIMFSATSLVLTLKHENDVLKRIKIMETSITEQVKINTTQKEINNNMKNLSFSTASLVLENSKRIDKFVDAINQ